MTGTALVLSGGGVRGAYEAGVIKGAVRVLGDRGRSPFDVYTGTSVGALNTAYLVANAQRSDLGIDGLSNIWSRFDIQKHLRMNPLALWRLARMKKREVGGPKSSELRQSFLDGRFVEALVRENIDWRQLHENIKKGVPRAWVIAALDIRSGQTTLFAELGPHAEFRPSHDPRRRAEITKLSPNHVLASSAIPFLYPPRQVGDAYFCDGGLRFNTPIAPAIRSGADRLMIISAGHRSTQEEVESQDLTPEYPNLVFLLGKIFNALLLDSMQYDLQVLDRFNTLFIALEESLTSKEMKRVQDVLVAKRGAPYRRLQTLVFTPSEDIGRIAADVFSSSQAEWDLDWRTRWILNRVVSLDGGRSADLLSYFLFDARFTKKLLALGEADALARADEIRNFFRS